jgi:hypothetical protein
MVQPVRNKIKEAATPYGRAAASSLLHCAGG